MKVLRFNAIKVDDGSVKVGPCREVMQCVCVCVCACVQCAYYSVCVCVWTCQFTCISTLNGPKSEDLSWVWPTHSPGRCLPRPHPSIAAVTHAPPPPPPPGSGLWCFADDRGDIWMYNLRGTLAQQTPPVAVSASS